MIRQTGALNGRKRRALDSTALDDAVATQDTVTQLAAAIRKVRKLVPDARQVAVSAHDYDKSGKPDRAWDDDVARDALVTALVTDAIAIIDALPVVGLDDDAERAAALLALAAGQDVPARREARDLADRPRGRQRPDRVHRRSGVPPRAQIPQLLPGRAQRAYRERAGDRVRSPLTP
ncbi:MAG: hypothetical protein ACRD0K_15825 [Egibacteraceae bacterium]